MCYCRSNFFSVILNFSCRTHLKSLLYLELVYCPLVLFLVSKVTVN
jgi:hypothetical protein